jgi:hypothetical protein
MVYCGLFKFRYAYCHYLTTLGERYKGKREKIGNMIENKGRRVVKCRLDSCVKKSGLFVCWELDYDEF